MDPTDGNLYCSACWSRFYGTGNNQVAAAAPMPPIQPPMFGDDLDPHMKVQVPLRLQDKTVQAVAVANDFQYAQCSSSSSSRVV